MSKRLYAITLNVFDGIEPTDALLVAVMAENEFKDGGVAIRSMGTNIGAKHITVERTDSGNHLITVKERELR